MTFSFRILTCILALGAVPASAQQFAPGGQRVPGTVNVQSTMSMSVPADATQNPSE